MNLQRRKWSQLPVVARSRIRLLNREPLALLSGMSLTQQLRVRLEAVLLMRCWARPTHLDIAPAAMSMSGDPD